MVWDSYIRPLLYHDSSFSLFGVTNSPVRVFCYRFIAAPNSSWRIKFLLFLMFSNCKTGALAVPLAQAGAAQNQAQDAQNVDGGEQPAAVAAPVAVPAAQPVRVVSCSCPLLAYLLSFCYRSLACFAGRRSIVSRFPAYVFREFVSIISLL